MIKGIKSVQDVIVALVIAWLIYNLVCTKKTEGYYDYPFGKLKSEKVPLPSGEEKDPLPSDKKIVEPENVCGSQQNFLSTNLLPKGDSNMDEIAEFAPQLDGQNFVDSYKYVFGSQSQSLRNANYQLRSEPANPKMLENNPWMNSTIVGEERRTKFE